MVDIKIYPQNDNYDRKPEEENLQIQTYGRRLSNSQTVIEYLIEFLLVFIGENEEKTGFDKALDTNKIVKYKVEPNIALKRFIFFENSKMDNRFEIDEQANDKLIELLRKKIYSNYIDQDEIVYILRELFHGFSAVTKDRGWFAKALLPMSKETIFCEAMGKKSVRGKNSKIEFMKDDYVNVEADTKFEFKEYNFQARGGEVYFLHVIQGFKEYSKKHGDEKGGILIEKVENRINSLINSFNQFSILSKWIQGTWKDYLKNNSEPEIVGQIDEKLTIRKECKWILKDYEKRAYYTVQELETLLDADSDPFEKFELLTTALIVQILRFMSETATRTAQRPDDLHPMWLIHIPSDFAADKKVKKLASEKYKEIEENMVIAVSKMLENADYYRERFIKKKKDKSDLSLLKDAYDDSHKLLRKLGKEIGLIIPLKGGNMRFTLSDRIVRFLVLSIVKPSSKITLDRFFEKLYEHFGIVIREKEYSKHLIETGQSKIDASYLQYNSLEFSNILRKNGFLTELSDATAIVRNPYGKVED